MPTQTNLSIQQLYDDTREALQLGWFAGFPGGERRISGDASSAADQVGHLNLIHPGRLQVFGHQEIQYYNKLSPTSRKYQTEELVNGEPPAFIIAQGLETPPYILQVCDERNIPLFSTPLPAAQVIDYLRVYLSKELAQRVTMHGVFMDVLGVGVLITGESGLGKSELGLELISRNHGLVADDEADVGHGKLPVKVESAARVEAGSCRSPSRVPGLSARRIPPRKCEVCAP